MSKILVIDDENNIIEKFLNEIAKYNIPIINLSKESNTLCYKNIKMNKENREVFNGNEKVFLTVKEFEILKLFMENPNKVFSRELILDKVWGYDYYGDSKIVNTHIKNIRKKLSGELKIMDPTKEDDWQWFDLDNLPEKLYSPSRKFIETYLQKRR